MFKSVLSQLLVALQPYVDITKPFIWAIAEAELSLVIQQLQLIQSDLKVKSGK